MDVEINLFMRIILACILTQVISETVLFCEEKFTTIPCVQHLETLNVTLNEAYASNEAQILLPTEWANALPPKNFSLKSKTNSIFIGGEITTDYFSVDESKRWNASLTFSTFPNELKNITQVRMKFTVVNVQHLDEFWSTIYVHVNDNIYKFPFKLFKVVDPMSPEGTSTTPTPYYRPTKSPQTTSEIIPIVPSEFWGRLYFILFILFAFVVLTILLIWKCFGDKFKRWCCQGKITDSFSHQNSMPAQMPLTNPSSRGDATNAGETQVVNQPQVERVDPIEQQQPTSSSSQAEISLHAPTEACTYTQDGKQNLQDGHPPMTRSFHEQDKTHQSLALCLTEIPPGLD